MENSEQELIQDWIFTFGSNHFGEVDGCLFRKYMVVRGTHDSSRHKLFEYTNGRFAMQYPSKEAAGVEKYNMNEVQLQKVISF